MTDFAKRCELEALVTEREIDAAFLRDALNDSDSERSSRHQERLMDLASRMRAQAEEPQEPRDTTQLAEPCSCEESLELRKRLAVAHRRNALAVEVLCKHNDDLPTNVKLQLWNALHDGATGG